LQKCTDELCGQFTPHQLDSSLYLVKKLVPKKKLAFTSVLIFLGFGTLDTKAQFTNNNTEQVDSVFSKPSCHNKEDLSNEDKEWLNVKKRRNRKRQAIKSGAFLESRGRWSTYISWRYPFIVRSSNMRGKFR
jgi:hypothetical protein